MTTTSTTTPALTSAIATTTTPRSKSTAAVLFHGAVRRLRVPAALASLGAAAYLYNEYLELQKLQNWESSPSQKLALSIAFDQLELIQQPLSAQQKWVRRFLNRNENRFTDDDDHSKSSLKRLFCGTAGSRGSSTEKCTLSVVELVRLIHMAAQDRHITALFGTFGNVSGYPTAPNNNAQEAPGWSDWEEIRNALTVFSQSHRRHYEPPASLLDEDRHHHHDNMEDEEKVRVIPRVDKKPMYCFASNLGSAMTNPGNPTYYLASVFHRIHLQSQGELELLGVLQQSFFVKPLLEKYGIQFHVFKQGAYKTAPNALTESTFTKAHRESATNLVSELDANLSLEITHSRSRALLTSWLATKGSGGKATPRCNPNTVGGSVMLADNTGPLQPHSTVSPTNPHLTMNGGSTDKKKMSKSSKKAAVKAKETSISFADVSNAKILQFWQRIHEVGTFPAHTAWKAGLVDCLPRRHPLRDLLAYNRAKMQGDDQAAAQIKSAWEPHETDFEHFSTSTGAISLADYQIQLETMNRLVRKRRAWYDFCLSLIGDSNETMIPALLKSSARKTDSQDLGIGHSNSKSTTKLLPPQQPQRERIVCLDIIGAIDEAKARSVVAKLRALQEHTSKTSKSRQEDDKESQNTDQGGPKVKCLVLRVVSPGGQIFACEQISQELQALDLPVVVSFGNVAASGGYYISAHANRIFGSLKTITGSIGVFGLRADLTGWAKQNGIKVEHVASGSLAALFSAFAPMTPAMKENLAYSVDRWYEVFQQVVQEGRKLSPETVAELAQGKIWTGRQAKEVGLLDEIGGYERAVAYAKRSFCEAPPEDVEVGRLVATTSPSSSSSSSPLWALFREYIMGGNNYCKDNFIGPFQWRSENNSYDDSDDRLFGAGWWSSSLVTDWEEESQQDGDSIQATMSAVSDRLLGRCLVPQHGHVQQQQPLLALSGILLTVDETSAIQLLLQDQYSRNHRIKHNKGSKYANYFY